MNSTENEEEIWDLSDEELDSDVDNGINVHSKTEGEKPPPNPLFHDQASAIQDQKAQALVRWIVGFVFILQSKHHLPNSAIDYLIKFIGILLSILSKFSPFVRLVYDTFPSSLHVMRNKFADASNFSKYPVCPKCNTLYSSYDQCVEKSGSQWISKHCSHVKFPNHPYTTRHAACNAVLMKSVHLKSGQTILYPLKMYCYNGFKSTFQRLLMRPTFIDKCNHWRSRPVNSLISDIYDGRVWKDFLVIAGESFLQAPFTFGLMINIDWFQPYTHTVSSVGVIYLTVMNLPRTLRFKLENIIIVGIIPGPSEPEHDINSFLLPLVQELLDFWSGVPLQIATKSGTAEQVIRCALLCVSCDLPAARKACGFLSYTARLGCLRCLKEFSGKVGEERDFSGFDRSKWTPRGDSEHRANVKNLKKCSTKTALQRAEAEYGCRYSVLLDLPYFSPTRFLVVDPMHNLFLGTGKRMLTLWIEFDLISRHQFDRIQLLVDKMVVPADIGRIPTKISSGFSGFKADQFKAWILIYSVPALYNILPTDHFETWRHFVLGCRLLCMHSLSDVDLRLADNLLLQFCVRVERLFGAACITPNMHMHGHLRDVVLDYGPIHEFWCYSFERFNGVLGKQPSSNRSIEPQLLKQFLLNNTSGSFDFPEEFGDDFHSLDLNNSQKSSLQGSVLDTITSSSDCKFLLPSKYKRCTVSEDDAALLQQLFIKLNPLCSNVHIHSIYKKYESVTLKGKIYRSSGLTLRNHRPCIAWAIWNERCNGTPPTSLPETHLHPKFNEGPVDVHYYASFRCTITSETEQEYQKDWTVARVSWLFPHPKRYQLGKPAELWCSNLTECHGIHSFLPLNDVLSRCAYAPFTLDDDTMLVVVPL